MSSFSFLVFAVFDFSQKKPQSFLSSRPILADFCFFWGNNSSKQKKNIFWPFFGLWTYIQVPQPKDGKIQLDFQIQNYLLNILRKKIH